MPRERNLAGLATISLPSRATARVAPTIHGHGKAIRRIVGATLAVALVLRSSWSGLSTAPKHIAIPTCLYTSHTL